MTPTLSVDAVHDSVTPVPVTALVESPVGVEGGVVSGQALVDAVCVAVPDVLPAAS